MLAPQLVSIASKPSGKFFTSVIGKPRSSSVNKLYLTSLVHLALRHIGHSVVMLLFGLIIVLSLIDRFAGFHLAHGATHSGNLIHLPDALCFCVQMLDALFVIPRDVL